MKVSQLKALLKAYKKQRGGLLWPWIHTDAIKLEKFLKLFKHQPNHELTPAEIFRLAPLLVTATDKKLTANIVKALSVDISNVDVVLALFNDMAKENFTDLGVITIIYQLDHNGIAELTKMLALLSRNQILVDAELFGSIIRNSRLAKLNALFAELERLNSQSITLDLLDFLLIQFSDYLDELKTIVSMIDYAFFDRHAILYIARLFSWFRPIAPSGKDFFNQFWFAPYTPGELCDAFLKIKPANGTIRNQTLKFCLDGISEESLVIKLLIAVNKTLGFMVEEKYIPVIFSLSENNLVRFRKLVFALHHNRLLTNYSFAEALNRVTIKLLPVKKSTILKWSRKVTLLDRSEIMIGYGNFFMEHNADHKYAGGTFGTVKKGYKTRDGDDVRYAIKTLKEPVTWKASKEAQREVKFLHLLGRQALYYQHKQKFRIVSHWQQEKKLTDCSRAELQSASVETRFKCLCDVFADLDIIHANFRMHGDISFNNLIINLSAGTMKLIDFGSAHKVGSPRASSLPHTPFFCQFADLKDRKFSDDIYSMGLITAYMFPELFNVYVNAYVKTKQCSTIPFQPTLEKFVDALLTGSCTSRDALYFCKDILPIIHTIDNNQAAMIAQQTLFHQKKVEDVLRMNY